MDGNKFIISKENLLTKEECEFLLSSCDDDSESEPEKQGRFIIFKGSGSHHCCFEYTVMDTTKPVMLDGEQVERNGVKLYDAVCECYLLEDAVIVCDALNKAHK